MSDVAIQLRNIPGLKAAVVSEASARERLSAVRFELEKAFNKIADATERRAGAIEAAASGQAVNLTKIERDLAESRQAVGLYEAALVIAEKAADRAEEAVASVLRSVFAAEEREARAQFEELQELLRDVARRRIEAAEALAAATRRAGASVDALRSVFAAEIAAVS